MEREGVDINTLVQLVEAWRANAKGCAEEAEKAPRGDYMAKCDQASQTFTACAEQLWALIPRSARAANPSPA